MRCCALIAVFIFGALTGVLLFRGEVCREVHSQRIGPLRAVDSDLPLIQPLIDCPSEKGFPKLDGMEERLRRFIGDAVEGNRASSVSLYYHDLNHGPWLGIREEESFPPASLFKVLIAMAYFKMAEEDPSLLKKKLVLKEKDDLKFAQVMPSLELIEYDTPYSVEELVSRMLIFSDNRARHALFAHIDEDVLRRFYPLFQIRFPEAKLQDPESPLRGVAGIFHALFNASLLTKEASHKILHWLSRSERQGGLVAGVPADVVVAHKFGERRHAGVFLQLVDCGIVYAPGHPYLLCVLAQGEEVAHLSGVIKDASAIVYDEVKKELAD